MEYWCQPFLKESQPESKSTIISSALQSHSPKSPRLSLDLWSDILWLGCIPPFRRPLNSVCQLVTANREVIDIPVGPDISCDDIIHNMNMLDHQAPQSNITGNYDEDFPLIGKAFKTKMVPGKSKRCQEKKALSDYCFVHPSDVQESEVHVDENEYECVEKPKVKKPDDWVLLDHPNNQDFEIVDDETDRSKPRWDNKKESQQSAWNKNKKV